MPNPKQSGEMTLFLLRCPGEQTWCLHENILLTYILPVLRFDMHESRLETYGEVEKLRTQHGQMSLPPR